MGNRMAQPYNLNLKDYHEFSWVVAALNFFVTYGDTDLGDCYYNKEECKKMFDRLQEEFLEYYWEVCKREDYDGKEYCAFEDNYAASPGEDFMCYYYDKEEAKERAKSWNLCNTTSDANSARITMSIVGYILDDYLWEMELAGEACKRKLTSEERAKVRDHYYDDFKKWVKSEEGQEWLNSDEV